jgi:hypothetical protein
MARRDPVKAQTTKASPARSPRTPAARRQRRVSKKRIRPGWEKLFALVGIGKGGGADVSSDKYRALYGSPEDPEPKSRP